MKKAPDNLSVPDIDLDNPEFRNVETLLNYTRSSVFMTGKAGTGKSTFLKYITSTSRKRHVVLAPTGIAAVNAGGQTLHSFFHIPLKPLLPDDPEFAWNRLGKRMRYPKRMIKMLRELDLIIIDEISMVRADVIDFIDKILRFYCNRRYEPFGGKQLLMVGDVFQLEPVTQGQSREILRSAYGNDFYFFSARVFRELEIVPIELRKVYRQTDQEFIGLLDRVRAGVPTRKDFELINSRVVADKSAAEVGSTELVMTIAARRDTVSAINEEHLARLDTKEYTFTATVEGDFPESSFPTDRALTLKEGAQVVFIKNDPERRWVNGTLGRVSSLREDFIEVEIEDGNIYEIEREGWGNVKYDFNEETGEVTETPLGAFFQYPLKLAWAITIHKSQGLTFSRVNIDVGAGAFAGGQTYVALSRCRSLGGITLASPMRYSDIYVRPEVVNFAAGFNNPEKISDALALARADSLYAEAARAFASGDFSQAVEIFAEASALKPVLNRSDARRMLAMKLYELDASRREDQRRRAELGRMRAKLAKLAEEYVALGDSCLDEGWDTVPARANYQKALDLNPDSYGARLGTARVDILEGDVDAAVNTLSEAVKRYERYEAPYELGCLYLNSGDLEASKKYLKKALKIAPKSADIYIALADLYDALGDPEQAARYRSQASELRDKINPD
ncbi:MAG: AAA family ATPase [Muribaculaceae bacterium]|nr:AAA family ATPase [Muribaculaceae bacterium]